MKPTDDGTRTSQDRPSNGDTIARSDGGRTDVSPLEALGETSNASVDDGWREKGRRIYDSYLYTPASIMWYDWRARIGLLLVVFYLVMGVFGPYVVEPPRTHQGEPFVRPFQTWAHPLGTDNAGADLLSLTVHSTLPILQMMIAGGLFTVIVGTVFGAVAGYKGGIVDTVLSTVTDIFINIPGLPLVIVLAVIFAPENPYYLGILLSVAAWAGLARSIRSQVLTLRSESFTEASRTMGLSTNKIILKDILPHLMTYISVNLVHACRNVIFAAVGLYFIGVLPYSDLNWGVVLNLAYNEGAHYRMEIVHWLLVPMAAIIGISMGMILLAQSLDRVFNPRVRAKHAKTLEGNDGEDINDTESDATGWF